MAVFNFSIQSKDLVMRNVTNQSERFITDLRIYRILDRLEFHNSKCLDFVLYFENIGTVNGVTPTDIDNAGDLIIALKATIAQTAQPISGSVTVLNPTADPEIGLAKLSEQQTQTAKLTEIANKDFATQTTLDQIKAKTDNLDVSLNTISKLSEQQTQTDKINQILALSDFQIQMGLVNGVSKVLKSGRNSSVTSSSVPEDIWNGSTVYTGFPTGAPEVLQFFSSNAGDTGVVTYFYLANSNSTVWQTATVTLNGTTPVSGVSAYRVHSASYDNGGTVNLGTITCRHSVTTANIFFQMPIGTCQTYVASYTVPAGNTAFVKKVQANVSTTNSITLQCALYIRELGKSPRLRRNFDFSDQKCFFDDNVYLKLNEKTDITIRITSSSSNTAQVIVGNFELILINQIL